MRFGQPITSFLLMLIACGCAGSAATIPAWQQQVETYVRTHGGDPSVLSDVTIPGDRIGFFIIGQPDPAQSTDVNAVLLGHRPIAGKLWFIYLVGKIEKQQVVQIRPAALSIQNGRYIWRLASSDPKALEQYRAAGERLWRQRFAGRATAPPQYLSFPREEDSFDVQVADDAVTAIERTSGARWELWLQGKPRRRAQ